MQPLQIDAHLDDEAGVGESVLVLRQTQRVQSGGIQHAEIDHLKRTITRDTHAIKPEVDGSVPVAFQLHCPALLRALPCSSLPVRGLTVADLIDPERRGLG